MIKETDRKGDVLTMAIFDGSKKLENEELNDVNGGYVWFGGYDSGFVVINDKTGKVLAAHLSPSKAKERAIELGQSSYEITTDELMDLRNNGKQPEGIN